jgi:REP element-mobilizing transposase RayT
VRSRYAIKEAGATYFVTSTIVAWLPVFISAACCDIVVESLLHCREHKGLKIYAWVILDNHFHAILSAPDLAGTLTDLKRYTARALLAQIEKEKREWLLNQLAFYRAAHKSASERQVWQEGVHPQEIGDDAMMEQKLDYIHNNPVLRGLVGAPEHWRYSSAHEWLVGGHPLFKCDPWK